VSDSGRIDNDISSLQVDFDTIHIFIKRTFAEQESSRAFVDGIALVGYGMEVMSRKVFEGAAMGPLVLL